MKRTYRLRKPDHFRRVRREGRTLSSPRLLLNVAANRRKGLRFGFVVGKQIGNAVQRNRAKRRVREAVRLLLDSVNRGYDLVFVVRSPEVATIAFATLQADIELLLQRARVWQEHPTLTTTQGQ